ncbi:MAG: hypothetical protein JWQ38_1001 [Flavipsychrobacter sp.]|nr:hypothetical protein [Flavipsychrobacter sp.]
MAYSLLTYSVRVVFICFILLFPSSLLAQKQIKSRDVLKYLPVGWQVRQSVTLDLNKDGINDQVVIADSIKSRKYEDTLNDPDKVYYPMSVIVLLGQTNGKYRLLLETSKIFGNYCGGIQGNPPFRGVFKTGLVFYMDFVSGGTSGRQSCTYFLNILMMIFT